MRLSCKSANYMFSQIKMSILEMRPNLLASCVGLIIVNFIILKNLSDKIVKTPNQIYKLGDHESGRNSNRIQYQLVMFDYKSLVTEPESSSLSFMKALAFLKAFTFGESDELNNDENNRQKSLPEPEQYLNGYFNDLKELVAAHRDSMMSQILAKSDLILKKLDKLKAERVANLPLVEKVDLDAARADLVGDLAAQLANNKADADQIKAEFNKRVDELKTTVANYEAEMLMHTKLEFKPTDGKSFGRLVVVTRLEDADGVYVGEVDDDSEQPQPHGRGERVWADGDRYVGEWSNGRYHGRGEYYWANGNIYAGAFKEDKRSGRGTLNFTNGDRYEIEYLNDQRHGSGVLYLKSGRVERQMWKQGELVGD